jgi:hypothetical protein
MVSISQYNPEIFLKKDDIFVKVGLSKSKKAKILHKNVLYTWFWKFFMSFPEKFINFLEKSKKCRSISG